MLRFFKRLAQGPRSPAARGAFATAAIAAFRRPFRKLERNFLCAKAQAGRELTWINPQSAEGTRVEVVDGFPRRVWVDANGREVIELFMIGGMGHGTAIGAKGHEGLGKEGKYMLEVGISSTRQIARFRGLTDCAA